MDDDKLRLAATLIEQSPPGQVNDVLRGKLSASVQNYSG
jgi:hypothetical protein